jgi:hypothetical protein
VPVAEHASGTTSALVIGTETFLGTDPEATDGIFQFVVNLANLVGGTTPDQLEIKLYEAALAADGASDQIHSWPFSGVQSDKLWMSPAMILLHRWRLSLKQTQGTGRTFKWSIRKIT